MSLGGGSPYHAPADAWAGPAASVDRFPPFLPSSLLSSAPLLPRGILPKTRAPVSFLPFLARLLPSWGLPACKCRRA